MKILTKPFLENLKSISNVVTDFVFIDTTDENNYGFYVSTDKQAMKIPLMIEDIADDEKDVYVINKTEFMHLVSYVKDSVTLKSDYSYVSEDGRIKGKFESNEGYKEDLESVKVLFDNEDEYEEFMEVTPSIMSAISSGNIFVEPDSIKPSERFLDIQHSKVFSYSNYRIYMDDIDVANEGLLSSEVVKSIQSLGIGAIVKNNNDSFLVTNAQRSIFEYFSTPNDVDFHPLFTDGFQKKLTNAKSFNQIKFDIEEFKSKLDYISFYASKNPNQMGFINVSGEGVSISTDENTFAEIPSVEVVNAEGFENFSFALNCSSLQLIVGKIAKDVEYMTFYVSEKSENKLVVIQFGDTEETVILAKLNNA